MQYKVMNTEKPNSTQNWSMRSDWQPVKHCNTTFARWS